MVSPLLANIALNGIESLHKSKDTQGRIIEPSIRYADDMLIFLKPNEDAEAILHRISEFLAERGMKGEHNTFAMSIYTYDNLSCGF